MSEIFTPGQIIKRTTLHDEYGGSGQSGISSSAKFPYIFIFSGSSGHKYGYTDNWDNENVFAYTGEGTTGDMQFKKGRGNVALLNHLSDEKRVFLFESDKDKRSYVRYICELEYLDYDHLIIPDVEGNLRKGIRFFLKRKGAKINYDLKQLDTPEKTLYSFKYPENSEKQSTVTTRIGQGAYRKSIVNRWEGKCAVTGFNNLRILIASHIHPWADSSHEERFDIHNGILLSPTYDALFDKNLISFENNGKIILSESIPFEEFAKLGVTGQEQIKGFCSDNHLYLERHRNLILRKNY